ncbi:MAG: TolC family protein [Candidatus Methylomirabilales bacterium]
MGNLRNVWIGVGALAALFLWIGPALGQEKPPVSTVEPPPVSGSALRQAQGGEERRTAELTVEAPVEPPAASPAGPPAQVMVLSLKESILLGLRNNLDIAIEGFNPKIREADVTVAKAVFDPAAFAEIFFSKSKLQNRSGLALNAVNENEDIDGAAGIRQFLPTGANYEVRYGTNRNDTNTSFLQVLNPAYTNDLTLTLTQPLLKNFGVDVNRTAIKIAQNDREISGDRQRQRVMDVITQVQTAYWELVFTLEDLKVAQRSLGLAKELSQLNRARVRAGVAAPVEVTQAETDVAAREAGVTVAEKQLRDAEDRLKVVLNIPAQGEWGGAILPADPARFDPVSLDLPGAIADGLQKRPEYRAAKVDLASRELNVRFTRNQLLPDLALEGSVGANGLGGNFGKANEELVSRDFYEGSVGLVFSFPLGNRAARAEYLKAQLGRDQARVSLRSLELNITAEVREAVRRIERDGKLVDQTRAARVLAEEQLRIETKRLEAGVSTTFEVLRFQRELAVALSAEVRSLTNYNSSIANLDRARGVALEKYGMQM